MEELMLKKKKNASKRSLAVTRDEVKKNKKKVYFIKTKLLNRQ